MVISFDKDTEQILEDFLNTDDPERVKSVAKKYSDKLFFARVKTNINYSSNDNQYIACLRQIPRLKRAIESDAKTSIPKLKALNGCIKTDREWEESLYLIGAYRDRLNVGFDKIPDAKDFIENQLEQIQEKLEKIGRNYNTASEYEEKDLVLTEKNRANYENEKIVVEDSGKNEGQDDSETIEVDEGGFVKYFPWRR